MFSGSAIGRRFVAVVAAFVGVLLSTGVSGQVGPFQPWMPGAMGGVGTDPAAPGGFTLLIDDDGLPGTAPVPYIVAGTGLESAVNFALSPSRDTLYAAVPSGIGTGPELYFVNLDGAGGLSITHGPFEVRGAFGPGMVMQGPLYYDSASGPRVAVTILSDGVDVWAQVFDLETTGALGRFRTDLEAGVGTGEFAPGGSHLVIQNGLSDGDQFTEYTLINVCGQSADFGTSSVILANSSDIPPQPVWEVVAASNGTVDVVATIGGMLPALFSATLPDCVSGGPATGACCETGVGGITTCTDGVTAAACGGTFFVGMTCSQVTCGGPAVTLNTSAPSSVTAGGEITYTFTVVNTGSSSATDLVMQAFPPFGYTTNSFSAGGTFDFFSGRVSWNIPSLAPGQSRQFSIGVLTNCTDTSVAYASNRADVRFGNEIVRFSQSVTTSVVPGSVDGLGLDVQIAAVSGVTPVRIGDVVRHTLTVSNVGADNLSGVRIPAFGCVPFGNSSGFGGLVDADGGVFETSDCGSIEGFNWTVDLPAGASRTLVFETVTNCPSGRFFGTDPIVELNGGGAIRIGTGDSCDPDLLGPFPPSLPAVYPLDVDLAYAGTGPGTVRFNTVTDPLGGPDRTVAVGRAGQDAEVTITISNSIGPDLASVRVEYLLNTSFGVASGVDPFAAPPPPGVSWDPVSEAVVFEGPLAEGESVVIAINASMESPSRFLRDGVTIDTGGGCAPPFGVVNRTNSIIIVPDMTSNLQAVGTSGFEGYYFDLPSPFPASDFPVFPFEFLVGIESGIEGTLYFSDLLDFTYALNPFTLRYNEYGAFSRPLGADPVSGGVLHSADNGINDYLPDGSSRRVYEDPQATYEILDAVVLNDGSTWVLREDASQVVDLAPLNRGSLPSGPSDFEAAVAAPMVDYPYAGTLGTRLREYLTSVTTDGAQVFVTVVNEFGDPAAPFADYRILSLLTLDPATRQFTAVERELGAFVNAGFPALPVTPIRDRTSDTLEAILPTGEPILKDVFGTFRQLMLDLRIASVFVTRGGSMTDIAVIDPSLSPCLRADIATPMGVLDSADQLAFVALVEAGDLAADLDGDGVSTFLDLIVYQRWFDLGCDL